MKLKRHLLSSATALVAIMALAAASSAQTDDSLQQDQQAAVGVCDLAFQEIDEAGIDEALAQDLPLMRDSALRLEEYGRTDLCIEIADAIREIADDPEQGAAIDEPAEDEDLAEAEPETLEPTDDELAEAPGETEAAQLDEPDAEDMEVAEADEPAAVDDDEAAELDEPAVTDTETAEVDEEVDEQVTEAERPTETFLSMQEEDDLLAGELIGANVEDPEGETLGSISDVVIRDDIGVKAVVIGVGGFLGIGQKKVAVNYQEIEHRRDEYGDVTLVFAATRDQLDEAPEFQTLQDQIAEAERQHMELQQDLQTEQPLPPAE